MEQFLAHFADFPTLTIGINKFWINALATPRCASGLGRVLRCLHLKRLTLNKIQRGQPCIGLRHCTLHFSQHKATQGEILISNGFDFCFKTVHCRAAQHMEFNGFSFGVASADPDARWGWAAALQSDAIGVARPASSSCSVGEHPARQRALISHGHNTKPSTHHDFSGVDRPLVGLALPR